MRAQIPQKASWVPASATLGGMEDVKKMIDSFEHHAVLFLGAQGSIDDAHLSDLYGDADIEILTFERLTISDARALKERASSRPVAAQKRRFIVSADRILREAQHALLKLFEDPPATAQFFLFLESGRDLLPTLRSRFHVVEVGRQLKNDTALAQSFLALSPSERIDAIGKRHAAKDTAGMDALFKNILVHLTVASRTTHTDARHLKDVVSMEAYMQSQGASKKMLLEHLALSLP